MVDEGKQARSAAGAHDNATRLGEQARHAWDAWVAAKLQHESAQVDGVELERDEVAYCSVGAAELVEARSEEPPTVTDSGSFVVTNQRCVFVGSERTTEWAYAKLIGYSLDGEAMAMFDVSDRQEATGVKYSVAVEPQVDATIAAAIARFHGGDEHAVLVDSLQEDYHRVYAEWEEVGSHTPPTA
jgi:hypothetical protein